LKKEYFVGTSFFWEKEIQEKKNKNKHCQKSPQLLIV
jgi:hypothetical protein